MCDSVYCLLSERNSFQSRRKAKYILTAGEKSLVRCVTGSQWHSLVTVREKQLQYPFYSFDKGQCQVCGNETQYCTSGQRCARSATHLPILAELPL